MKERKRFKVVANKTFNGGLISKFGKNVVFKNCTFYATNIQGSDEFNEKYIFSNCRLEMTTVENISHVKFKNTTVDTIRLDCSIIEYINSFSTFVYFDEEITKMSVKNSYVSFAKRENKAIKDITVCERSFLTYRDSPAYSVNKNTVVAVCTCDNVSFVVNNCFKAMFLQRQNKLTIQDLIDVSK